MRVEYLFVLLSLIACVTSAAYTDNDEWELLSLINNERAALHLAPLQMMNSAHSQARYWASLCNTYGISKNANLYYQISGWGSPPTVGPVINVGESTFTGANINIIKNLIFTNTTAKALALGSFNYVGIGSLYLPTPTPHLLVTVDYVYSGSNAETTYCCGVAGAIGQLYRASYTTILGNPVTNEGVTPDWIGRFTHFQYGSIYWTQGTGAQEIQGIIRSKWASLGWETSALGYPTTCETSTPDNTGKFNHFQRGSIYWTPSTGAHTVLNPGIRDKWASLSWERGFLKYPISDDTYCPDLVGRFVHFQGGSIYYTPSLGAHFIRGTIYSYWASIGYETSTLKYPTTDEYNYGTGQRQDFQGGSLYWNGATVIRL